MNIYIMIILIVIAAAGGVIMTRLHAEKGWRKQLQREKAELKAENDRLRAELEKAKESPIGYNQLQAFDELIALALGSEKRMQLMRELAVEYKRGNWRAQKKG